jgi:hypothetical protein
VFLILIKRALGGVCVDGTNVHLGWGYCMGCVI